MTRLVLVNAIYFKGLWNNQFDKKDTKDQEFYITPDQTKKIPMMNKEDKYRWATQPDLGADLLAMDYKVMS